MFSLEELLANGAVPAFLITARYGFMGGIEQEIHG